MSRRMRAGAGFAVIAVLATCGVAPAAAAPEWVDGLPEDHFTQTCESIGLGQSRNELSSQVRVSSFVDRQALPKVGEVFYARVAMAAVGGCTDKSFIPEVLPPVGVEVAISAANPVRCHFTLPDGSDTALGGCPQALQPGIFGGLSLAPGGNPRNAWTEVGKIPGTPGTTRPQVEIVYVEFPLRASRTLTGLPGGPSCAARAARVGPCPRDAAGDFLQVAVTVFDVTVPILSPAVGLVVEAAGGGAPTPSAPTTPADPPTGEGESLVTVPRSMRIRSALNGIAVRVAVPADGARVTARLSARGLGRLASVTRRGVQAGSLRLRMRPTRSAARKLRRARRVTASLRVSVQAPGAPATVETIPIRLRR